ncbi:hypothetical protein CCYA_CCYA19G4645 [Cyanidiococcus yangmingshanensis]|nr:hypothetical protein CCYA_CCYA19G4645 [Cyanidiococcus yangmingshanensis]
MCAVTTVVVWYEERTRRVQKDRRSVVEESGAKHEAVSGKAFDLVAETLVPYTDPIDPVELRRLIRILTQFARDLSAGSVRRALLLPDGGQFGASERSACSGERALLETGHSWRPGGSLYRALTPRRMRHRVSASTSSVATVHAGTASETDTGRETATESRSLTPGAMDQVPLATLTGSQPSLPPPLPNTGQRAGSGEDSSNMNENAHQRDIRGSSVEAEPVAVTYRAQANWHVVVLDENAPSDDEHSQRIAQNVLSLLTDSGDTTMLKPETLREHIWRVAQESLDNRSEKLNAASRLNDDGDDIN